MADGIRARDLDQRFLTLIEPRQDLPLLMLGQLRWSPHVDTSRFGAADSVAGPGANQLALELGNAANDRDHQPADRRRGVGPGLTQRFELGAGHADLVSRSRVDRASRSSRVTNTTSPSLITRRSFSNCWAAARRAGKLLAVDLGRTGFVQLGMLGDQRLTG